MEYAIRLSFPFLTSQTLISYNSQHYAKMWRSHSGTARATHR